MFSNPRKPKNPRKNERKRESKREQELNQVGSAAAKPLPQPEKHRVERVIELKNVLTTLQNYSFRFARNILVN